MTNDKVFLMMGLLLMGSIGSFMVYQSHNSDQSSGLDEKVLASMFPEINDLRMRVADFKEWQKKYNKVYNDIEEPVRFQIWNKNYDAVEEHNAKGLEWELEMNMFADLTDEEFVVLYTGFNGEEALAQPEEEIEVLEEDPEEFEDTELGATVDWRTKGAVTKVENQGQCGGCWSFSAGGALSGLYKIKKGKLISFSKQQQIDCSKSYGNQGCNGGLMVNAFKYTRDKGIERESDYSYKAKEGSCRYSSSKVVFKNKGHKVVGATAAQLKTAVKALPVAVAVQADQNAFKLYKKGVLSSGCGTSLNHAILAVGYGTTGGKDYWIVKNSWGTSWGESGYMRLARGSQNGGKGICGINMSNSYPTI